MLSNILQIILEVRSCNKYPDLHEKAGKFQLRFCRVFPWRNQAVSLGKAIEEGRGLCEYQSSQKVAKIIRKALGVIGSGMLGKGWGEGEQNKCRIRISIIRDFESEFGSGSSSKRCPLYAAMVRSAYP